MRVPRAATAVSNRFVAASLSGPPSGGRFVTVHTNHTTIDTNTPIAEERPPADQGSRNSRTSIDKGGAECEEGAHEKADRDRYLEPGMLSRKEIVGVPIAWSHR